MAASKASSPIQATLFSKHTQTAPRGSAQDDPKQLTHPGQGATLIMLAHAHAWNHWWALHGVVPAHCVEGGPLPGNQDDPTTLTSLILVEGAEASSRHLGSFHTK